MRNPHTSNSKPKKILENEDTREGKVSIDESIICFQVKSTNPKFLNLEGQIVGRWVVLGYAGAKGKRPRTYWFCKCECGTIKHVSTDRLRNGQSKSCGCLKRELVAKRFTKHGATRGGRTPEYRAYQSAKARCQNPKDKSYARYGGRGIEFRFESYAEFLQDIGRRPSPKHSVDRENNNGHYEKGNVRWATPKTQGRNKRNNRFLVVNGETRLMCEWAEVYGIKRLTIHRRLKLNWCETCAVTLPPSHRQQNRCTHNNSRLAKGSN